MSISSGIPIWQRTQRGTPGKSVRPKSAVGWPKAPRRSPIGSALAQTRPDLRIIFSTYQSAHHTADALLAEQQFAQVLILDEAHRTAQLRPAKSLRLAERLRVFTLCHDQATFPARFRIYQTATPRVYDASNAKVARIDRTKWTVAGMSDESIFGPVAYRLAYKDAVQKEFLSDYRIIAIGVDDRAWAAANRIVQLFEQSQETRRLTTREALSWLVYGVTLAGGAVGGDDGSVRVSRSLAFLNKVQRSGQMVKWLDSDEGRSEVERYFADGGVAGTGRRYAVEHLDAGHPVRERRRALRELCSTEGRPQDAGSGLAPSRQRVPAKGEAEKSYSRRVGTLSRGAVRTPPTWDY